MSKQAIGDTTITLTLLNADPLLLTDTAAEQPNIIFDLNTATASKRLDSDSSSTDPLSTDLLDVVDAPDIDSLFSLGTATAQATAATAMLTASYGDPIEWGDPLTDQYYWRQQNGQFSCAVVAQISVYQSLTGNYIDEQLACNYAQAQGWFDPRSGTSPVHIGKILNALGISTTQGYNATLNNIAAALAQGDKPIVALDANEIWNPKRDQYGNPVEQTLAGHAVWVTGIDRKANGSFDIVLNDSGKPSGYSNVVSYADFYNAWTDYSYFVSVADNPFT